MTAPDPASRSPDVPSEPPAGGARSSTPPTGDGGSTGHTGAETAPPETFPASYVAELRQESAGWRVKAQRADTMAARLVTELARATGKMADPSDLPYSEQLLGEDGFPDPQKVNAAVDDLVARKPHLADRRPRGSVDQGARGAGAETVDLASILRARAG